MIPAIPSLEDYGISPEYGFLPDELPLELLPDPYYNRWEAVVANLQALILSRRLREVVNRLPILSTSNLLHPAEWRRAYMLLAFMTHGYIWGGNKPEEVRATNSQLGTANTYCREFHRPLPFLSYKFANTSSSHRLQHMQVFVYGTSSLYSQMNPSILSRTLLLLAHSLDLSTSHGSTSSRSPLRLAADR